MELANTRIYGFNAVPNTIKHIGAGVHMKNGWPLIKHYVDVSMGWESRK